MYPALTLTLYRLSRESRVARAIGLFAAVVILGAPAAARALTSQELLVVVNERASISGRIADYYQQARGVPKHHLVRISTEPEEEIDRDTFKRELEGPIAAHLLRHRLVDQILGFVLTKGVPLKIRGTEGRAGTRASVDSELTLLYRELVQGPIAPAGPVRNPYFRPGTSTPFARAEYDIYLVTRLDGYAWEDVRGLIDRAAAPARHGKVVLDMKGAWPGTGSAAGDGWLKEAADRLKDSGLEVILDQSSGVVTGGTDVIGYAGWGSNDPANTRRSPGFQWLPGALASWFVSSSGRTFIRPPASWTVGSWSDPKTFYAGSPQSLIGDLIAEGVTGTVGYVYEPYLDATAQPQILFPAYRAGFTLAESFYMALPYLSWQSVVIGDPLVAPFAPATESLLARPAGVLLFLERRAAALETAVARTGSPETRGALARVIAETALELTRLGRLDDALGAARRALALETDDPAALYALGTVHAARREYAEAREVFRTLIHRAAGSPYARAAAQWLAR
jgi:uncharacterized protein (TIGR03790 family)